MNKSDIMKAAQKAYNIPRALIEMHHIEFYEALIAAAKLLKQVEVVEQFSKGKWLPIEKGYYDAEVYLCYFPENKGVEKYKTHSLLSVAKIKGATHYMIPQLPVIIDKEGV